MADCLDGIEAVIHTATLHKPHVATHSRQDFVDSNVTGTLNLLEEACRAGVRSFVFTSTTSAFGAALEPAEGAPAAWITEEVPSIPRNIYGVTKTAAEDLCQIFHRKQGLACLVLRTSRFFPEEDDNRRCATSFADGNAKANEFLFRRLDLEDAAAAHLLALERRRRLASAATSSAPRHPSWRKTSDRLREEAPAVVARRVPEYEAVYRRLCWRIFPSIHRVYVNRRARDDLGWQPAYDFRRVIVGSWADGRSIDRASDLRALIGRKGYHGEVPSRTVLSYRPTRSGRGRPLRAI